MPVRVLVVDDSDCYRCALVATVEATEGFEVVGAVATGEESVSVAREIDPDLVLMDVHLPDIDGFESTRRIRRTTHRPAVLLLSTCCEDEYAPRAAQCGALGYIDKCAFGPDRLSQTWDASSA